MFINLKDNAYLDREGFTVIGRVVQGMDDVVSRIFVGYKDGQGQVGAYNKGKDQLKEKFPEMWEISACSKCHRVSNHGHHTGADGAGFWDCGGSISYYRKHDT